MPSTIGAARRITTVAGHVWPSDSPGIGRQEARPALEQAAYKFHFRALHLHYQLGPAQLGRCLRRGGIAYIDALFMSAGAATQSGLNTRNLNELWTYQQVFLYWVSMFTTPIFIHGTLTLVRLYWFERRFQNVVRDARALRATRSRMSTVSKDRTGDDTSRAERGVGGRSIVVLRNNAGDARGNRLPNPVANAADDSSAEPDSASGKGSNEQSGSDETDSTAPASQFGLGSLRVPTQLNPETHIAFVESQRNSKGALRIPSPREYDRGGVPEALEEVDEDNNDHDPEPKSPSPESPTEFRTFGGR
ncbi:Low-affinity potassium transport protein [Penicillium chermesinum]|nr:Low-affinity potassium transport protein [Penicillium chermesinum]